MGVGKDRYGHNRSEHGCSKRNFIRDADKIISMEVPKKYERCFGLLCCLPELYETCPIKKECLAKNKEKW